METGFTMPTHQVGLPYLGCQLRDPTGHIIKNPSLFHLHRSKGIMRGNKSLGGCGSPVWTPGSARGMTIIFGHTKDITPTTLAS